MSTRGDKHNMLKSICLVYLTRVVLIYSKVPRPEKLASHVFEVDEDADKEEVRTVLIRPHCVSANMLLSLCGDFCVKNVLCCYNIDMGRFIKNICLTFS